MSYWEKQTRVDVSVAIAITLVLWLGPLIGFPVIFIVDAAKEIGRSWLSPVLTLLGMTAATTAFVFAVVDRSEFKALRGKHAESQLWRIFGQNIGWLAVSAVFCAILTFLNASYVGWLMPVGTFLIIILCVCVLKFAWVMRQIIFVRVDQTGAP